MANENRPTTLRMRRIKNVAGVAAGAFCSDTISGIANNVHYIMFTAKAAGGAVLTRAQLITDIARMCIKLDGTPIFNVRTTAILDLYKYYGDYLGALAAPLGTIVVPFVRPNMPAFDVGRAFALGLKKNADPNNHQFHTLSYELTCNAGLVTAASIEVYVFHDIYDPESPGLHVRTLEQTRSNTATGEETITDLPRTQVGALAYHWAAGTCTSLRVIKNGVVIVDNIDINTYAILQGMAKRTPQAGYAHLDLALTNDLNGFEALGAGVTEWDVRPTWSAAPGAGYVLLSETIHDGING